MSIAFFTKKFEDNIYQKIRKELRKTVDKDIEQGFAYYPEEYIDTMEIPDITKDITEDSVCACVFLSKTTPQFQHWPKQALLNEIEKEPEKFNDIIVKKIVEKFYVDLCKACQFVIDSPHELPEKELER